LPLCGNSPSVAAENEFEFISCRARHETLRGFSFYAARKEPLLVCSWLFCYDVSSKGGRSMSDFSSNLRRLRKRAGLSQDALAEKLSVARQTVSSWEHGVSHS
jgi:hypothetical protein